MLRSGSWLVRFAARVDWLPLAALVSSAWIFVAVASVSDGEPAAASAQAAAGHDLHAMARRLSQRLEQGTGDAAAWTLLARSWAAVGEHKLAREAYARASALDPQDAVTLAEWAQSRVLGGERVDSRPVRDLVGAALQRDPAQALALALDGDAAYERGELARASARWQAARAVLDAADTELAATLERRLSGLDAGARGLNAAFGR
jgi:cytochrome c-type biogenesis protein CcmH